MKKAAAIVLCLIFVCLSFFGCRNEDASPGETSVSDEAPPEAVTAEKKSEHKKPVSLGYYAKKTLNPFKTDCAENQSIATLLFDSLFVLDSAFKPVPAAASDYEIDGRELRVTLKPSLYFTDGSPLTGEDVIYSFAAAKKSPVFEKRLQGFKSVVPQNGELVFAMKEENIFAAACLNFPIVKYGTAEDGIPVGSGRYTLEKKKKPARLVRNESYSLAEEMSQEEIGLYDLSSSENELYLLQIGELTCFFDNMSRGSAKQKISAGTADVSLNRLVFLGFNNTKEPFSDRKLRKAAASAVSREAVADTAYNSLAAPCENIFNPDWYAAYSDDTKAEIPSASDLLESCGYIYAYPDNEFRSKDFDFLTAEMIVGEENENRVECAKLLRDQLVSAGIDVRLSVLPFDEYLKRLQSGDFDLYVGEVKLTPDMELSVFFAQDGAAGFTIDNASTAADAYFDMKSGKIDMRTFVSVFDEYLPLLPLCYRRGTVYYSRELKYDGSVNENNIFSNIYSWETD